MNNDIIITGIFSFVGTLVGFIFGLRRKNAETDKIVLENVKGVIEVYTQTIEDMKKEIQELKKEIKDYRECIDKLEEELHTFKRKMEKGNCKDGDCE